MAGDSRDTVGFKVTAAVEVVTRNTEQASVTVRCTFSNLFNLVGEHTTSLEN